MMTLLWVFFFFVPALAATQAPVQHHVINSTDLQQAIADMRARSFHGFVLLLKLLNTAPNSIPNTGITFLMPASQDLSDIDITQDNAREFIATHSIPMALTMRDIVHFPDGSLIPSRFPQRMLGITNSPRPSIYVNNARIVMANVCVNAMIRCHGISAPIVINTTGLSPALLNLRAKAAVLRHGKANSSAIGHWKRSPINH